MIYVLIYEMKDIVNWSDDEFEGDVLNLAESLITSVNLLSEFKIECNLETLKFK